MPVSPRTRARLPETSSAHSNLRAAGERGPTYPPKSTHGRRPYWTEDWAPKFIEALIKGVSVTTAAHIAGVHFKTPYDRRKTDKAFREAWIEACEISTTALEQEVARRAYHGTTKGVYYKGVKCGSNRVYSDTLAMFLLKARRPDVYRDSAEDPSGKNLTLNIQVVSVGDTNTTIDPPGLTLGQTDRGGGTGTQTDAISISENRPPSVQGDSKG